MSEHFLTRAELVSFLLSIDSPHKYFPVGFDIDATLVRAQSLAKDIYRSTLLQTIVEDPSYFQDGSLFCRIILKRDGSEKAGEVLLSSFGNLATTNGIDESISDKVVRMLKVHGYTYVPIDSLDFAYSGGHEAFKRSTWLNRYFSSFHVIDST